MKGIEELQFDDRDSEKGLEELSKQSELESAGNILEYTDTCFTSPRGIIAGKVGFSGAALPKPFRGTAKHQLEDPLLAF